MVVDELFMHRCFHLARLGAGKVAPNPIVGAVVTHSGRILGEGWHERYGQAHAEVNALEAVTEQHLLPEATLYCSLEPCFHYGKTPPCVDLILRKKIRRVVVSCIDPNPAVAGQSLEKLKHAGVEVVSGLLETEGKELNRIFFTWITQKRPYVLLKWAQSADGYMGLPGERTPISGPAILRYVHRLRSEYSAILVGAATARTDNPKLDTRLYFGPPPLRLTFDRQGLLPSDFHFLDDTKPTWIFGPERPGHWQHTRFIAAPSSPAAILQLLYQAGRSSLIVEGGPATLRQWIDAGLWDEIRILENKRYLYKGIPAPKVNEGVRHTRVLEWASGEREICIKR